MAVRLKTKVAITASLDDDEKKIQYQRPDDSTSQTLGTVAGGAYEVEMSGELELGAAEADYSLPLGKVVTGKFLYIETTGDLTVKLDGEAVGHKIKGAPTGYSSKLVLDTEFTTAPSLTNNGSAVAQVSYFIAGLKT